MGPTEKRTAQTQTRLYPNGQLIQFFDMSPNFLAEFFLSLLEMLLARQTMSY